MRKTELLTWWPYAAWALVIFLSSNRPIDRDKLQRQVTSVLPERYRESFGQAWYDMWFYIVKGCHVAAYASLMRFAYHAHRQYRDMSDSRRMLQSAGMCILNAISDEFHQTRVPGRQGTLMDVMFDTAGISLSALLIIRKNRRLHRATDASTSSPPDRGGHSS